MAGRGDVTMKMYLVHYFTALLLFFAAGCEYPYGSRKEIPETSEAELIRTLTMLQGYFEKLGVTADGILSIVNTPVLHTALHEKTIIEKSNRAVAMFKDDRPGKFLFAGEVRLDGTVMETYEDTQGFLYHLHSKFHRSDQGKFPHSFEDGYPYTWEVSGSSDIPQFIITTTSPRSIIITNPHHNIVIDIGKDLEIDFTVCENSYAMILTLTPMKIVHSRNRATLRIGRAYSRYLYDTASPIIVPADTLATITHREDIAWDYFSLSLKSISIEDKLLHDGKRIKAVIVTGDVLLLNIVN